MLYAVARQKNVTPEHLNHRVTSHYLQNAW